MINQCAYCTDETNNTVEICIECLEMLVNGVYKLEEEIVGLKHQLTQKVSYTSDSTSHPAHIVRIIADRGRAIAKMNRKTLRALKRQKTTHIKAEEE